MYKEINQLAARYNMRKNASSRLLNLSRVSKRVIALSVDASLCITTVAVAYVLRLDAWVFPIGAQWLSYIGATLFALPLFIRFGLYRAIFRYVGWSAIMSVVRACAVYGLIYSFVFTLVGVKGVPRTVGVLQPLLLFTSIGASRAFARYWLGGGYKQLLSMDQRQQVLVYGAGAAGRQLAAVLANSEDMHIVAFVDDDNALQGSILNGKRIYSSENLEQLIQDLDVGDVLLAIPSASRQRRREIIENLRGTTANIRTLPGLMDLAHGRLTVSDLRELDVEDLLGRDTVVPDSMLLSKNISQKVVLVTGAGGSIGGELCRQILTLRPTTLLLIENCEFNLYSIHQELQQMVPVEHQASVKIIPILASVRDAGRIENIIAHWKSNTVYHAAAYKHVPLVEANVTEGVRNNVFGTLTVAEIAERHGVQDFVLISTDKAVRPTNTMGATKRLAEMILQARAASNPVTRFSMVRFGNVLGSSGSVVPLFRKQIKMGGPLTITHADITRYFMTIPEAAQLVIQAGAMATGGEVFVLDMGDPVKIIDLARRMIELSGLTVRDSSNPNGDIAIEITSLRPGEKLYEELLIGNDAQQTAHQRIMKANETFLRWESLRAGIEKLQRATAEDELRAILKALVPDFGPQRPVKSNTAPNMSDAPAGAAA